MYVCESICACMNTSVLGRRVGGACMYASRDCMSVYVCVCVCACRQRDPVYVDNRSVCLCAALVGKGGDKRSGGICVLQPC